ncbi:hypothetical protein UlMin_018865 [Ulmus minor]
MRKERIVGPYQETNEVNPPSQSNVYDRSQLIPQQINYTWWLRVGLYVFFILSGQAAAMLLGRLYYENGGESQWMETLVQLAGFPVLLPYYCISGCKKDTRSLFLSNPSSFLVLTTICVFLAILLAADCFLYSIGLQYLPVSTYSLVSASQLAFNAFFAFFLNSQKFTPYIVNSLVLLTISSTLCVFQANSDQQKPKSSSGKYAIGFICTVSASAGYGLMLSLTQFSIQKVLKRETFSVIMDMMVCESILATCVSLVGLFASGEWKDLHREMYEFRLGKVSYVMTLIWTAISWQAFFVGTIGLILEVSSLFSNVISVLGLPIVPVLAVFIFHEKMDGLKVIAMLLAIWGFVSYAYQNYLDDYDSKQDRNGHGEVEASM